MTEFNRRRDLAEQEAIQYSQKNVYDYAIFDYKDLGFLLTIVSFSAPPDNVPHVWVKWFNNMINLTKDETSG